MGKGFLTFLIVFFTTFSPAVEDAGAQWTIETVDSDGWSGIHTSIVLDSSDRAHISYGEALGDDLKYATNSAGYWVTETVDSMDNVGSDNSIALDSLGNVHISYADYTAYNYGLKYATNASGNWVADSLDNQGWRRNHTSIAIDSSDRVHISYSDDSYDQLNYISNKTGEWVREVLDSNGSVGSYTSIALDSSDNVHISYQQYELGGDNALKYATNASGNWVTATIETGIWNGAFTSIAIDSSDKVHISYQDEVNGVLKYATNASGNWVTEIVDSSGFTGRFSSLALDSFDRAHISYSAVVNNDSDLRYATNISDNWEIETVDSVGYTGIHTSIAIDSSDLAHISYCDYDNNDLKYATNVPFLGRTLNVNKAGTGSGTVTSFPGGINCGLDCTHEYNDGSVVILTPSADASSTFAGWSGGGCSGTGTCQVTMSEPTTVTATFTIKTYTITATSVSSGNITPSGAVQAVYGSDQAFIIAPDPGFQILDVVVDGVPAGAITGHTFPNVTGDHAITAYFTPDTDVILRTGMDGTGTGRITAAPSDIDCGSDCAEGYGSVTLVTLTALPDISSTFTGWSGGGCSGTGTCQVTMNADTTVTATFTIKSFTITTTAGANGSITPAGAVQVTYGSDQTFSITPNAGYYIEDVLADSVSRGVVTSYTFNNVTDNHEIEASFTSPALQVNPLSITETLAEGETSSRVFTVSNTGGAPLNFSLAMRETSAAAGSGTALVQQGSTPEPFITSIPEGAEYVPGELIVKLASRNMGASALAASGIMSNSNTVVKTRIPGLNIEVWNISEMGLAGSAGSAAAQSASTPASDEQALLDAIASLSDNPEIEYAEPNYIYRANAVPDDTRFDELWGLHNTGQTGGTADADIDAPEAWDFFTGRRNVVVAVIDTGVDYNHEDLASGMWINEDEIPGNGIDDDANGYIDDIYGYDFAYNDSDPYDGHFHGTHCAGVIGAAGGNGTGVAGINYSVRIMAVKFLGDLGSGSTTDAIDAVMYAVDNGADVMNNSWGGSAYSFALQDAITYANDNEVVFVASAGNDSLNTDSSAQFPASYPVPNIIAVAATDHNDNLSSFSNYGVLSVDLGAPGSGILSTTPNNNYASYSGTSMAAPHVSGAAALLKGYNQFLSVADIKTIIMNSADPVAALQGKTVSGGRLNIRNALSMAGPAWMIPEGEFSGEVQPGTSVDITLNFDTGGKSLGDYTADVTINSNDPANPVQVIPVTLTIEDAMPVADFTGSPTFGIAPLAVNFTNNSTSYDQPLTYEWDFDGNGTTDSVLADPSFTYTLTGLYTVTLKVTDSDGSINILQKTNYINVTADSDGDGILDDGDGNGIAGTVTCTGGNTISCDDNCVNDVNSDQADFDGDGTGDVCDADADGDGIDDDGDGDGIPGNNPCTGGSTANCDDNCPDAHNPLQEDTDGDLIGDACEYGAIDFTKRDAGNQAAIFINDNNFPSFSNQPFTIEAWIKKHVGLTLDGGVFSRIKPGVAIWLNNNVPTFGMIHAGIAPHTTSTYHATAPAPVSDGWTHVAAVMENKSHAGDAEHPLCTDGTGAMEAAPGIQSQQPHMDLYVNGVLVACSTTFGHVDDGAVGPQYPMDPPFIWTTSIGRLENSMDGSSGIDDGIAFTPAQFDGVVDEMRIWGAALTGDEINACMHQELALSGNCSYGDPRLFAYWPMSEGQGSIVNDWGGLGMDGDIQSPTNAANNPWSSGWAIGYPFGPLDSDGDSIPDGDGTNPCTGGSTSGCDDNCPDTPNPGQEDTDGDLIGDACDNCRLEANFDQTDSNYPEDDNTSEPGLQHYGNRCDPDFNNDGLVKVGDFNVWRMWFRNAVPPAPDYVDLDGDGLIKVGDFNIWRAYFRGPPGPGIGD